MWALLVVKSEVLVKASPGVAAVVVTLDIHFLVFERTPQTLGENIVDGPSLAVHAQVDALSGDLLRKGQGGKLRPLVGVDDARLEHGASLLQRLEQKATSKLLDSSHESTKRQCQSKNATRYKNPPLSGM